MQNVILMFGNIGVTELLLLVAVFGLIIWVIVIIPIRIYIRNQKLKMQNEFLKKDSLNLDLHKLREMKDKDLITEEEYQKKKEEILKRL